MQLKAYVCQQFLKNSTCILWLFSLFLVSCFILVFGVNLKGGDSHFYIDLLHRMLDKPASKWLVQTWGDGLNTGLFRDHMVGLQLIGAAGVWLKLPATKALYVMNVAFRLGNLFLYYKMGEKLKIPFIALIPFIMILTPNFFQSIIRADQEEFVLFFSLLILYLMIDFKKKALFFLPCCFAAIFLIKGFIVLLIFVQMYTTGLFFHSQQKRKVILSAILSFFFVILVGILYEVLYRKQSGSSFFLDYWHNQIITNSVKVNIDYLHSLVFYPVNIIIYFGRIIWWSFPISIIFCIFVFMQRKYLNRRGMIIGKTHQFLIHASIGGLFYILAISLSSRIASRYVYNLNTLSTFVMVSFMFLNMSKYPSVKKKLSYLSERPRFSIIFSVYFILINFSNILYLHYLGQQ